MPSNSAPKIKAKLRDPFEPTTVAAIEAFEREVGPLPADYRAFLLTTNGGTYRDYVCTEGGFPISDFIGLETGYPWSDLRRTRLLLSDWLPPEFLAVATTAGGDYACLQLKGRDRGKVYMIYHDEELDPTLIAASFDEYLHSIILDPEALAENRHPDPAFQAINEDNLDELRRQIDGRPIDTAEDSGKTLLMHAASKCRLEIVEWLLQQGASLEARDDRGHSAVFYAVFRHSPSCLDLLVQHGGNVHDVNHKGESPLTRAVDDGSVRCVKRLIELGADVQHRANDGRSLLDRCVNNKETIRPLLLQAGAK
jgi:hypothetical protein